MHFPPYCSSSHTASSRAFTLIELLVVISIIAVLAGLLLPVGNRVIENAKRVSAKSTMTQIVSAVKSYQSDYGVYPVVSPAAGNTPTDLTFDFNAADGGNKYGGPNHMLFNVLRALNNTATNPSADPTTASLNARRTVYFEYKDAKNPTLPIDGFVQTPTGGGGATVKDASGHTVVPGDLMDNWGNLYYIRVDSGYSDKVVDPFLVQGTYDDGGGASNGSGATNAVSDSQCVHTSAIAWSIGATHKAWVSGTGTYEASGNVATWK